MTTYIPPAEPGRTASRRSRPVPLVIGILLALVGLPLLLGGLGLGWAMGTQRDADGFFSTATERLTTETVALSSEAVKFGESGTDDWWADRDLATVRLSARSSDASTVFIGIAPRADVAHYLGRASYDEISDLRTDPFDYSLAPRGSRSTCPRADASAGSHLWHGASACWAAPWSSAAHCSSCTAPGRRDRGSRARPRPVSLRKLSGPTPP